MKVSSFVAPRVSRLRVALAYVARQTINDYYTLHPIVSTALACLVAETSPLRRRMIEDVTIRNLSLARHITWTTETRHHRCRDRAP